MNLLLLLLVPLLLGLLLRGPLPLGLLLGRPLGLLRKRRRRKENAKLKII
jgi:hypothetical protein